MINRRYKDINAEILYSGSSGNMFVIENILVDMGGKTSHPYEKFQPHQHSINIGKGNCCSSYKKKNDNLSLQEIIEEENIELILITHSHKADHFQVKQLRMILKDYPNIQVGLNMKCYDELKEELALNDLSNLMKNVTLLSNNDEINHNDVKIKVQEFEHSPYYMKEKEPTLGFHFILNNKKVFYGTDINNLETLRAKEYDYYFVEANYIFKTLEYNALNNLTPEYSNDYIYDDKLFNENELSLLNNPIVNFRYKRTILTHTSLEKCVSILKKLIKKDSKIIYLHLSKENFINYSLLEKGDGMNNKEYYETNIQLGLGFDETKIEKSSIDISSMFDEI